MNANHLRTINPDGDVFSYDELAEDELVKGYLHSSGVAELMEKPGVSDVAINRPGELWVETSDKGWYRVDAPHLTLDVCKHLANTLAVYNFRELTVKSPIKTVDLPDSVGRRAQLVIPPACERGTVSMTFREPSLDRFTLEDYEKSGRFNYTNREAVKNNELASWQTDMKGMIHDREFVAFFKEAVRRKLNIMIFGGTGSGKTTFAKAVVDVYPTNCRLITIEEINELKLPLHLNHVHLLYGDFVTPKELVSSCMRMKADHIFLAELTGDEAWDFMEILNTGHPGTITTAHSNSDKEGYARITGLIKQSRVGAGLDIDYIERRVRTSFDVVMYMEKTYIKSITYEPEIKLDLLNGMSLEKALSMSRERGNAL